MGICHGYSDFSIFFPTRRVYVRQVMAHPRTCPDTPQEPLANGRVGGGSRKAVTAATSLLTLHGKHWYRRVRNQAGPRPVSTPNAHR